MQCTANVFKHVFCLLGTTLASASIVYAADISLSKSFEIGAVATDNLNLSDLQSERDTLVSIKPALEATIEGNRFDSVIRGEVEYYKFERLSGDFIDPRLFARTTGDLIENFLFLDARLSIAKLSQDDVIVRPIESQDPDPILRSTQDLDHSLKIRLNPYIDHTFGTFANLRANYRFQIADRSIDGTLESQRNDIDFLFGRDPKDGGFLWGIGSAYSSDEFEENNFTTGTVFGRIGSSIGQTVTVEINAGTEFNDFENLPEEDEESQFLNSRITWAPSENTTVAVGYNDRFFGEGPTFFIARETLKTRLSASFDRSITRARTSLDSINGLANPEDGNTSVIGADGNLGENPDLDSLETDPFVDNSLNLTLQFKGRRTNIRADAIYSQQEELDGSASIDSIIGRIAVDRQLSPVTTLQFEYSYVDRNSDTLVEFNHIENRFGVRLNYTFD